MPIAHRTQSFDAHVYTYLLLITNYVDIEANLLDFYIFIRQVPKIFILAAVLIVILQIANISMRS